MFDEGYIKTEEMEKENVDMVENGAANLLKKIKLHESQKKSMPKFKKKFLGSYSKIGRFTLK